MSNPTKYSKVVFRTPSGAIEAVVEGPARVVRSKIKDAMKRHVRNGSPKFLAFWDVNTGRSFKVMLAQVETWKVSSVVGRG